MAKENYPTQNEIKKGYEELDSFHTYVDRMASNTGHSVEYVLKTAVAREAYLYYTLYKNQEKHCSGKEKQHNENNSKESKHVQSDCFDYSQDHSC